MKEEYYIPANSKRSLLMFGIFKPFDFGMFVAGIFVSFILLLLIPTGSFISSIFAIMPGAIVCFLVLPLPNYYNVRTFMSNAWRFYTIRQKFIWKGWCVLSEESREER